MAIDLHRKRLLVAELGNGSVDVVDLASREPVSRITGLDNPQGVAYVPWLDLIAVGTAGDGAVHFFAAGDYAASGVVALGTDADNIRLAPQSRQLIVGYGEGGLAIVDPASRSVLRTVKLAAHPESFQLDPGKARAFVNVPNAGQIAVVDLKAGRQVATWVIPGWQANFPMAMDAGRARIAVVFRNPARLAILDTGKRVVIGSYETCGDSDDLFFDHKRQRLYVSCGEGMIDIFATGPGGARHLGRIHTAPGVRAPHSSYRSSTACSWRGAPGRRPRSWSSGRLLD
jgi:hypothetical protein